MNSSPFTFSPLFDRAVAACAHAQLLLTRSVDAATRSRQTRQSARRIRNRAVETREAWRGADQLNTLMRTQITTVVHAMRVAGMDQDAAAAALRAHIRFVLYDGGLREQEAEPVVARANAWFEEIFHAA